MGLVTLVGLDVNNSPIHKTIWESFAQNRQPQRVPLNFMHVDFTHQYPKARPKRTSYDWYVPKGIVKTNWMNKHLNVIPAVTVVFYDLDWDDLQWNDRCNDLAVKVDQVRTSLLGRATKIGLVLVQKNVGLPGDQDLDQQQKAHMLCNRCGNIPAKSLFVLPYTEHLPGYVMRLENAFYEMSQNYYYSEARRVKSYRELLNKTTHQLLFVRHQFKAAYFNELKQDPTSALRHYKQAYEHIKELRMYDSHMLEVKVIAGFINYKICRISFQQSTPRDAISQFRQHVDLFKNKLGIKALAFEHSAWMSKQFCIFGELFSEAIGAGLTALITQHPGFYFQQAAYHTVQRRQQCQELCSSDNLVFTSGDPLESINKLDYFGQRPWRQGHQSIDPPEPSREREGIQALQKRELDVKHCWIIIPLLSSAVSQFKRYKSPRMKRYLIVQMGEEYFEAKEYAKSLELISHVMWEYRNERWTNLLHAILKISLRSAFLVGNVAAFVSASIELISKHIPEILVPVAEKSKIQSNLMRVLFLSAGNGCPEDNDLVSTDAELTSSDIESKWRLSEDFLANTFTIDASSLASFVEVKAKFSAPSYTISSLVTLDVCLLISSPAPISFSQLQVNLNESSYDSHCCIEEQNSLLLEPGVVKAFRFCFAPIASETGTMLKITSVNLTLGDSAKRCTVLTWSEGGNDVMSSSTVVCDADLWVERPSPSIVPKDLADWNFITKTPISAKIEPNPPKVKLDIQHDPPCLVNEFYVLKVTITNEECNMVTNLALDISLAESIPAGDQPAPSDSSTHINVEGPTLEGDPISRWSAVPLPDLEAGQTFERMVYMKMLQPGERKFRAILNYLIEIKFELPEPPKPLHENTRATPLVVPSLETDFGYIQCKCQSLTEWSMQTVRPFQIVTRTLTSKFEGVDVVYDQEPFLQTCDIKSISQWPIMIKTSHVDLSESIHPPLDNTGITSMLDGLTLEPHDVCRDLFCLVPSLPVNAQQQPGTGLTIPVGKFTLEWKRNDSKVDLPFVKSSMTLPPVMCQNLPLSVDLQLPPYGTMRSPMCIRYKLGNKTLLPQDLEIVIESSEGFMFSGQKQMSLRLLPQDHQELVYNLFPLIAGNVNLPRLNVSMVRYPGSAITETIHKLIPSQIFILPVKKGVSI